MASKSFPSLIPAFLALLIIILFAYLIYTDLESTRTEHTLTPPIEIIEVPETLPLTIINQQDAAPDSEQIIEQEAQQFVENLSPVTTEDTRIKIKEGDDQFARQDSIISLADIEHRHTTLNELIQGPTLTDDIIITISHQTEQRQLTTLAELSKTIEDQTVAITILTADGQTFTRPLAELISQNIVAVDEEITLISTKTQTITTHYSELASLDIPADSPLNVTLEQENKQIALKDIIPLDEQVDDALFYLHRVTEKDSQGLWGIIQAGLIDKFRQGLAIKGVNQNKEIVSAVIPEDADEKLNSGLSSFLGKILNEKVDNSYIYNFESDTMGRDANLIQPGQQLVLITFQADDLARIYQFFSAKRNQGIQTFAITD